MGVLCLTAAAVAPAEAQQSQPSRLALDTDTAVDLTASEGGEAAAGFSTDALFSFEIGRGVQVLARPILQRLRASSEWNAQLWLAALRYEGGDKVSVRVEAGLIPSPVGMANLLQRPHTNPTITQPASLFTSLPLVEVGGPRTTLLGAVYPLGLSATLSSLRWDVRAAVIDTSPVRPRRVFADSPPNPPRLANVVVGGGITPFVGVRIGASFTSGPWQNADENPVTHSSQSATIATVEADVSFRRTRMQAEWTRDEFSVNTGTVVAHGWFAQGTQTLSPRWFVAGRVEHMDAPAIVSVRDGNVTRQQRRLQGSELTAGYRLSPELTLRASHRMRKAFGREDIDHVGAISLVWWRRWM